jgi:hypothetical protein
MVALVPLLVAVGLLTGETAQLVLNVVAALLAVSGGGMALANLSPDDIVKFGILVRDEDDDEDEDWL